MIYEKKTRVLVTGVGGAAGVCAINSLRERTTLFVSDMDPYAAGFYLVAPAQRKLIPRASDAGFVDHLLALAKELHLDALVPTVDEELVALAQRRSEFEAIGTTLVCSTATLLEQTLDKFLLSKALEGVAPLPETHLFDDSFVAHSFPLIVKPRVGRGSRGIVLVRNQEELDHQERSAELIVQEYLPGEEYSVDVLCDFEGRPLRAVPRSRVRVRDGVATVSKTVFDDELVDLAMTIAASLGYFGVINVQFRRNKEGLPHVLEINPRIPGTCALTIAAGVDMPWLALQLALNKSPHVPHFREIGMVRTFRETYVPSESLGRVEGLTPPEQPSTLTHNERRAIVA